MTVQATVLCENAVYNRPGVAEHGWSVWIETPSGSYLFDTGQGKGLLSNAETYGIDLRQAQAVMLSHHHYDHTGGLRDALGVICGPGGREEVNVYAHPDLFKDSFSIHDGHRPRHIGVPFARSVLEAAGACFDLSREWRAIGDRVYLSGEVPRHTPYETGDTALYHYDAAGELVLDPIVDDQTVVIDTDQGLFVILGCSHAGLINILDHIMAKTGKRHFHTIIGGTHLGPVREDQVRQTIAALQQYDIDHLGVSHCTGQVVAARLLHVFGERFFFCNVGQQVIVG
ncbi:MAG: MBL fold metallo-hydrolase [Anaerolineae bacterium]|nr:MBL fold metallo-hydrolase [Anaerolineae bacterium]